MQQIDAYPGNEVGVKWLQTPSPIQLRRGVTLRAPLWLTDGRLGSGGAGKVTPLRNGKTMTLTPGNAAP
ncbi:MAG: hypothetical protein JO215_06620 [Ktedonobacteraceae bacterium]|nr:hypothetical protein [Ktedonobacteraceae bacterium]